VRYNWIDGGNRQLDLVNAEDSSALRADLDYGNDFVYGNVIIEHPNSGNNDTVLYGGDTGAANKYRKKTLYFYNNTFISYRTDAVRLFRMSTNDQSIDARNNIAYVTAAASNLQLLDNYGRLTLTNNWFKAGYTKFTVGHAKGSITFVDNVESMTGSPGFVNLATEDLHLASGSGCIDAGVLPTPTPVDMEYVKHQSSTIRAVTGTTIDIGAYEF
jgi:hypothetical protein